MHDPDLHGKRSAGFKPLWICVLLLFSAARPASAYTDPGTGALLWQVLTATAVGALYYFRRAIARLFPAERQRKR